MILSIETSTPVCTIAVHEAGILLGSYELHTEKSHSEALTQMIGHLMKVLKLDFSALKAIAFSEGPGSYTGLRIGSSTAKGLCYGLKIPFIAVSTMQTMASQVAQHYANTNSLLCPMIDARRVEVYTACFSPDLAEIQPVQAKIIDEASFSEELEAQKVVLFGNGAAKCGTVLQHPNLSILSNIVPHARDMGLLAYRKYQEQQFEDVAYFEPFYLKDFVATKSKKKSLLL